MYTNSDTKDDHYVHESQAYARAYNMTSFKFAGLLLQAYSRLETKPDAIPAKSKDSNKKTESKAVSTHKPDGGITIGTIDASQPCRLHPVCMVSWEDHNWQTCADLRMVQCSDRQFFTPVRTKQIIQKSARKSSLYSLSSQRRTVPSALVEASSRSSGE